MCLVHSLSLFLGTAYTLVLVAKFTNYHCYKISIKWQLLWKVLNKSEKKMERLFRRAFHLVSQLVLPCLTIKDSSLQPSGFPTKSNHFNAICFDRCFRHHWTFSDQNTSSQGPKREMYGHHLGGIVLMVQKSGNPPFDVSNLGPETWDSGMTIIR